MSQEYRSLNKGIQMKNILLTALLGASLSACSWVQVSEEGKDVSVVKSYNVEGCKKLGQTVTQVRHTSLPGVERDKEKMIKELTVLAKNQAAKMGGDSIVSKDDFNKGAMTFDIYKCKGE